VSDTCCDSCECGCNKYELESTVALRDRQLKAAREALEKIYEDDPEGIYAGPIAKQALAAMGEK
jgi:hypothetical protein